MIRQHPLRGPGAAVFSLLTASVALGGCGAKGDSVLVIRAKLAAGVPAISASKLQVAITATVGSATHDFAPTGGGAIVFPTSLSAIIPRSVAGPFDVDIRALGGPSGTEVLASRQEKRVALPPGSLRTIDVELECPGGGCSPVGPDAAADAPDGGSAADTTVEGLATCGNGQIDPGETCDTAIAAGKPGACPPDDCDDGLACTKDTPSGSRCTLECAYTEIRAFMAGDGCCPAGGSHAADSDCSATCGNGTIEAGESCDRGIAAGETGACPVAADCLDMDACTMDSLLSAGTCSARCVRRPVTTLVAGDGCCPAGGSHNADSDCPVICGNGDKEPGETCDTGIAAGNPGACPTACDDGMACTSDTISGAGCMAACRFSEIKIFSGGDGCCPTGGNNNVDSDCPVVCGNAVVETGEACDQGISVGPGACPATCPPDTVACTVESLSGSAADCSARCRSEPITACTAGSSDGCCPSGCTFATDPDCSATCGNGTVEPGESCDVAIPSGSRNSCPTSCSDGAVCTRDVLQSAGTCNAACAFLPITELVSGDGCCPPGGDHNRDADCAAVCGNGVVEPPDESCDKAIPSGSAGTCPTSCPPPVGCDTFMLTGSAPACTARCTPSRITACVGGDGCCPAGCHRVTDGDCPAVCGNAVHEPGEACDKAITAGNPGSCPVTCNDQKPCTTDTTSGNVDDCTRSCSYTPVSACGSGDQCCPMGCTPASDSDCAAVCGNGTIEAGETCDPPSSCPTTCPDDGVACTVERLSGDPTRCTAVCGSTPITSCSGTARDGCCPTGCNANTDADCAPVCGNSVTELGEECDDGNSSNADDCVAGCRRFVCGDGYAHTVGSPPLEACDDGNSSNADDCVAGCRAHACGDNYRHTMGKPPFEECDDGNLLSNDACSMTCKNVEFAVSAGSQEGSAPAVAVTRDGDFVVTWVEPGNFGASVIRARVFTASGIPRTGDILMSAAGPMSASRDPDATASERGDSVLVAYTHLPPGIAGASEIRGRLLDPTGGFMDAGEIRIAVPPPDLSVSYPRVTFLVETPAFFTGWRAFQRDRRSFDGTAIGPSGVDPPFTLIPYDARPEEADVAPFTRGAIAFSWSNGDDIYAGTYDEFGFTQPPVQVNVIVDRLQGQPAMATDSSANRFILWSDQSRQTDFDCGSTSCGIEARVLVGSGSGMCMPGGGPCLPPPPPPDPGIPSQFSVNSDFAGEQKAGDVAAGRRRFVTVFETGAPAGRGGDCSFMNDCDVAMRLFKGDAPATNPFSGLSTDFMVNQDTAYPKQRPRVAVGLDGTVVVVWETMTLSGRISVRARVFEKLLP